MEKLKERLALAERAVSKLEELASMDEWTEVERDAMIQRFEFSYEILWKCAYDEEFAVELSARMKDYGELLRNWLEKIRFDRQ